MRDVFMHAQRNEHLDSHVNTCAFKSAWNVNDVHAFTHRVVPHTDTWPLSPPDEDQNASDRRLPLVWRRCIHAATDTVVRRPHGRLPGDRLARLDLLARRRLAEEAPGRTAPKLRGAHARNSEQGVLMRRQTWRTPDVAATLRPMVRNAAGRDRSLPAWRPGTNFFKQNYPGHECPRGCIFHSFQGGT